MTVARNLGPLDWRTPIVDKQGRPSPEFQRRWALQVDNNQLIGFLTVGEGPPLNTPTDDGEGYVDITPKPFQIYISEGGTWGHAAPVNFIDLVDVPRNYTGAKGLVVQVNAGGTGLQFVTTSAILDVISVTQGSILYRSSTGWVALGPSTDGKVLTTHGAGANPTWETAASGGGVIDGATINTQESSGSTSYVDLTTVGPSVTLTTGTKAFVTISSNVFRNTNGFTAYIAVGVSGATTYAPSDNDAVQMSAVSANSALNMCRTVKLSGLTAGTNTFTMKYRTDGASFTWYNRNIQVQA